VGGVNPSALADTTQALQIGCFSARVYLMLDETWRLCGGLFDIMGPLLGRYSHKIELEASVFGWALNQPELCELEEDVKTEKIGDNFGMSHPDLP
jgi:hypothetical protein